MPELPFGIQREARREALQSCKVGMRKLSHAESRNQGSAQQVYGPLDPHSPPRRTRSQLVGLAFQSQKLGTLVRRILAPPRLGICRRQLNPRFRAVRGEVLRLLKLRNPPRQIARRNQQPT